MILGIASSIIATIIISLAVLIYKRFSDQTEKQFKEYLQNYIHDLENDDPSQLCSAISNFKIVDDYVPLSAVIYSFKEGNKSFIPIHGDIKDFLVDSVQGESNHNYFLIIGEFGTGKTTLVTRFAYDLGKLYLDGKSKSLPVLMHMKYFTQPDMIGETVRILRERYNMTLCTRDYFVKRIKDGTLTLILDGLDEYFNGHSGPFPTRELKLLEEIVTPKANIIITSRRNIFRTSEEMIEYLKGRTEDPAVIPRRIFTVTPVKIIELQLLNNTQIKEVLRRKGVSENHIKAVFTNQNILELSRQHILLEMITQTIPGIDPSMLSHLSLANLYETYIASCILRDEARLHISNEKIEHICRQIALKMYADHVEELDQDLLSEIIHHALGAQGKEDPKLAAGNFVGSLLFITFTEGKSYRFIHRTIMEFFVAKGLVHAIRTKNFTGLNIKGIAYHEAICHFTRELLTEKKDVAILIDLLNNHHPWVRFIASHFLSRLNYKDIVQLLTELLGKEKDFIVLREFYIALAFLGEVKTFHHFIDYLDLHKEDDMKNDQLIIEYFGGHAASIDGCIQRLGERKDYPTREMLLRFLGHKGNRRHIPLIRKFDDDTCYIKETARKAMEEIRLRNKKPEVIRAILLDLDGVVIDSIDSHIAAWQEACSAFHLHLNEAIIRLNEGLKSAEVARKIFESEQKDGSEEEIRQLVHHKNKVMTHMQSIKLMPHVRELALAAKKIGAAVVLVTASHKAWAETAARLVGLELITHIVSEEDTQVGKPDPEPYLLALNKARCSPNEAIVIENAPFGIDSALFAGIYCIGLTSTLEKELLLGADKIIDTLLEAVALIQ